jgi:hypothetical protein
MASKWSLITRACTWLITLPLALFPSPCLVPALGGVCAQGWRGARVHGTGRRSTGLIWGREVSAVGSWASSVGTFLIYIYGETILYLSVFCVEPTPSLSLQVYLSPRFKL